MAEVETYLLAGDLSMANVAWLMHRYSAACSLFIGTGGISCLCVFIVEWVLNEKSGATDRLV